VRGCAVIHTRSGFPKVADGSKGGLGPARELPAPFSDRHKNGVEVEPSKWRCRNQNVTTELDTCALCIYCAVEPDRSRGLHKRLQGAKSELFGGITIWGSCWESREVSLQLDAPKIRIPVFLEASK